MKEIQLEEKYIKEYINDTINSSITGKIVVNDALYHHNTSYILAPSIIKNGILSIEDINKLGIRKYSKELLNIMADIDSHVNGKKYVSLSVVGLKDLYPDEEEYDPYKSNAVDFLISSNIKTYRMTIHYGNEYISESILPDKIKSLDIRLLKYLDLVKKDGFYSIESLMEKYNSLKEIALLIKETNLNIPIREMSNHDNLLLDTDKLANAPKLLLKK